MGEIEEKRAATESVRQLSREWSWLSNTEASSGVLKEGRRDTNDHIKRVTENHRAWRLEEVMGEIGLKFQLLLEPQDELASFIFP